MKTLKQYETNKREYYVDFPNIDEEIIIDGSPYLIESCESMHPEYRFICKSLKNEHNDFYLIIENIEEEDEDLYYVGGFVN